jgi:hypothetical protein
MQHLFQNLLAVKNATSGETTLKGLSTHTNTSLLPASPKHEGLRYEARAYARLAETGIANRQLNKHNLLILYIEAIENHLELTLHDAFHVREAAKLIIAIRTSSHDQSLLRPTC